ncbi:hypothetical protein [Fibrella arboris]|uniref:hypothetical protein n=1 Tax=Fibrella arboris TaxID=3242486 RepID=UPI003522DCBA
MTEKEFNSFTEEKLLEGCRACFTNAKVHFDCAQRIAESDHYGMASSHLILSVEEAIKGFVFWAKIFNLTMPEKVDRYFSQHEPRHTAARELYGIFRDLMEAQQEMKAVVARLGTSMVQKHIIAGTTLDEAFVKSTLIKDLAQEITLEIGRMLLEKQANVNIEQERIDRKWWKAANNLKNRGFYVDYDVNKGWILPENIAEGEYIDSLQRVSNILGSLERLGELNMESINQLKMYIAMSKPTPIELYEVSPNGTKIDIIYLTKVPLPDGSGFEYLVEFKEMEFLEKMEIGRVGLIDGKLWLFDVTAQITYKGMLLLANWIEANLEEDEE